MGSVYINDFDFNNRSYRVYLQADQKFRAEAKNMRSYYVKSERGKMIPLDDVVQIESTASPQVISHFNLFRSAEIDGSAAPGLSSGTGITAMEGLAKKVLPKGMTYEWSGLSLEEIQSSGKAVILFGLGMVFATCPGGAYVKLRASLDRIAGRARSVDGRVGGSGDARNNERRVLSDWISHVDWLGE